MFNVIDLFYLFLVHHRFVGCPFVFGLLFEMEDRLEMNDVLLGDNENVVNFFIYVKGRLP